ncbi:transmembrane protein 39A [Dermatophagoides farinae]|uniref:Transmembrane protein 39A n=2 Tax=Dermatophagoides farinae TaxID=6954 RepID=A0A922HMQ5_DERFA|nr:Transmembrane protein 39A [Dermatophagoides farinae]
MGKNNKVYLLPPRGRNSSKLAPKYTYETTTERIEPNSVFTPPDHVELPELSDENELLYEMQTIVIFVIAMSTQYLNLFRTFWWMPDTYRRYAMNFHLINPYVVGFCVTTIIKSFVSHLFFKFQFFLPSSIRISYIYLINVLICSTFFYIQTYLLLILFQTYSFVGLLTFLCPLLIYSILYSPNLIRTYQWIKDSETTNLDICLQAVHFMLQPTSISACFPTVQHTCTSISPFLVRDEVEKLKNIFNDRLKFIIFRSIYVSYYGSFLPLAIVPTQHEYDTFWTAQHIAVTCMCTFFMLTSHLYSPQFYDILHRSSLHLGKWQKLESRNTVLPCPSWTESVIYGPGIVVRHLKEYYKSEANMTCAEPGNQSHFRFYIVFSDPSCGFLTLLSSIIGVISFQFILLCRSYEWYKLISMSLLMLTNSLAVFRLMRSFWILKEIYKHERHFIDPKSE